MLGRYASRIAARPRTLVAQCDSFCNLACTYCYLPNKAKRTPMPIGVAEAIARSAAELTTAGSPLDLVWHAGEPTAAGLPRFADLVAPFELLRGTGRLRHYMQTNATLITPGWCEFFADRDFRIGVSIDGPAAMNRQRIGLGGKPAFPLIMKGIDRLRAHEIGFSVIAVVTTDSIDHPEALLDFFSSLGCTSVGFNIEEQEGVNSVRPTPTFEQAVEFWRRTIAWTRRNRDLTVREVDRLGGYLRSLRAGDGWRSVLIDPIPTVSAAGDVVLLSPELADTRAAHYDDFRAGNVLEQSIASMLADAGRLRYVEEFLTGLDRCEATCEFFGFCRGAQAGNRYFETGRFDTTETSYCRVSRQALVVALSDTVREEQAS
ncbi:cyclophane-forming radical SAM peptide maturase AmcB [Kitasatospora phosalacinea]|uniref:Radical SAM protein n=1 Tax=Kitasatospora phosalacinea TaxID=2065 RepID=A0A9W6PPB3_9ACTN|nr:cyclophane-forming radical SAM peptide maturase AmcB [Kitasatospora phosalacinea]GLW58523.1 radical SAM protein [Kitasatospora phosalacinea]